MNDSTSNLQPDKPAFREVHRTASFKIHNPSRRKREIMDYAFTQYTIAYQDLLTWARENAESLDAEVMRTSETGRLMWANDKKIAGLLSQSGIRPAVHSSLKDALYRDVAGNLLSYYKLRYDYNIDLASYEAAKTKHVAEHPDQPFKRRAPAPPTFPIARDPHPGAFDAALSAIQVMGDVDEDTWLYRQSELIRLQRGRFMPMYFSRPDAVPRARNFSLLADDEQGKYYVLLFLLPQDHEWGQPIQTQGNLRRLGHPATAGPDYEPPFFNSTSKCAILCPLEMGEWHVEEFLRDPCANVRSAFLIERNGDYFINVTFEFTIPAVEPTTVIGVDRGIAQFVAIRVLDFGGVRLHEELWSGDEFLSLQFDIRKAIRRLQKRGKDVTALNKISRLSDQTVHTLANRIVELAVEHKAQVVIENLARFDREKERFTKLRVTPYQKIETVLKYKLPLHGLPEPALVSPAQTSRMCAQCGYSDKTNRPDQATFICGNCGHSDHADLNAATNIALRWLARQAGRDWWPWNLAK
jgi:IS605 OrfB family transposase